MGSMMQEPYESNRSYKQALEALECKDYGVGLSLLTKVIYLFPDFPDLYLKRGRAYLLSYDTKSAVANFKKALVIAEAKGDKGLVETISGIMVDVLDWQGCTAFQRGFVAKAHRSFDEALSHATDNKVITFHRGISAYKMQDYQNAARDLAECENDSYCRPYQYVGLALISLLDVNFQKARGYIERGQQGFSNNVAVTHAQSVFDNEFQKRRDKAAVMIGARQFEDAGRILDDLVEAEVNDAELYRLRATCLSGLGMYSAAVQDLFESISKAGGSNTESEHQLSGTLISIAEELSSKGDPSQALEYYTEGIKWNPTIPQYFLKRGECYHQLKKHESALLDYKHVLDLDGENEEALSKLAALHNEWGIILFNTGDLSGAESEFSQAVVYRPAIALYYFHRAKVRLMDKVTHRGAIEDLEMCRKLGAYHPDMLRLINQYCNTTSKAGGGTVTHALDTSGNKLFSVIDDYEGPPQKEKALRPMAFSQASTGGPLDHLRRHRPVLYHEHFDSGGIRQKVGILMQDSGNVVHTGPFWRSSKSAAVDMMYAYDPYKARVQEKQKSNTAPAAMPQIPQIADYHAIPPRKSKPLSLQDLRTIATPSGEKQRKPGPTAKNAQPKAAATSKPAAPPVGIKSTRGKRSGVQVAVVEM